MFFLMVFLSTTSRFIGSYSSSICNRFTGRISSSSVVSQLSRLYSVESDIYDTEVLVQGEEKSYHIPVLLNECCEYLDIKQNGLYVDCTLGGGGHTREILQRGGRVIGLDQDPDSIAKTSIELSEYIESNRLEIIQTNFRYIERAIKSSQMADGQLVDGVLMDLGISSHQIDEPTRGFAFGADGPLDMRMGQGATAGASDLTAHTIINEWEADRIANILFDYGDETKSRQIAREIVASRPINTTFGLEKLISGMTSWKHRPKTLARCFQAIRICVNDEMGALDQALMSVHNCVKPHGKLVIMSYHSLEDRRVKQLLKTGVVHDSYSLQKHERNPWIQLFKRAQSPSEEEILRNRRSRSAKLRVAIRIDDDSDENIEEEEFADIKGTSKIKVKSVIGTKQLARMAIKATKKILEENEEVETEK